MASGPITYIRIEQYGAPPRFERVTGSHFSCGENQLGLLTFEGCSRVLFKVLLENSRVLLTTIDTPLRIGVDKTQPNQSLTLLEGASIVCLDYRLTIVPLNQAQQPANSSGGPETEQILSI
jgi:hypothetical protein